MARCFAVAMSHAPEFCGMPDFDHCVTAARSASCANSSATPTSRTMRVSPAMIRADSMRQTVSIARSVSCCLESAFTATDHITFARAIQLAAFVSRLFHLFKQARPALAQLGRERLKVVDVSNRPEFDFHAAATEGPALQPLDGFIHIAHLPDPVACDQLLRFRKRSVDDRGRVAGKLHAFPFGRRR